MWIEVVGSNRQYITPKGHSLYWECGLKLIPNCPAASATSGHSLYWECGLKCKTIDATEAEFASLPVLGVWIEVFRLMIGGVSGRVTPCIGSVD